MKKLLQEISEIAERLSPGFSTADAEYPEFSFTGGAMKLEFVDYAEHRITVAFSDAVAVNWRELEITDPNPRDDEVYEIRNSRWIADHLRQEARSLNEQLRLSDSALTPAVLSM